MSETGHHVPGSERGADRAAFVFSLLETAALNGADPQRWLADVLDRISDIPKSRLHELLPWNWERSRQAAADAMWTGEPIAA